MMAADPDIRGKVTSYKADFGMLIVKFVFEIKKYKKFFIKSCTLIFLFGNGILLQNSLGVIILYLRDYK